MSRLGKLLFGLAVAGATAATVYNYLDQKNSEPDEDFDDDFEDDDTPKSEEEDYTEKFMTAATRTYTTIKESSADAMAKVKEAIGPKGEEVLDVVGETAEKVKGVVADSAARVKDILQEEESKLDEEVVEEAVANALAEEMASEEPEACEAVNEDDRGKEADCEEEFPEESGEESE